MRTRLKDIQVCANASPLRVLILAVVLDWLFGDPPNAFHPVAWFGKIAQAMERRAPRDHPRAELLYGAGMTASGIALAALPAFVVERWLAGRGNPVWLPAGALGSHIGLPLRH